MGRDNDTAGVGRRGFLMAAGASGLAVGTSTAAHAKAGGSGGAGRLDTPPEAVVETRSGKLRGAVRDGVFTFKGAPYGKDTGGAGRFLPPQPFPAWQGVRSALTYGPCCPQVVRGGWKNDETAFIYDWDDGYPGEDCLRLNVWSAGVSGKPRPVMFWIHGGGYETGSSQELPAYDGERLARRGDLVVVSVNHRLGPFGFLDLSGLGGDRLSGNVGMLDLVAALEWVRDNIQAFGGDPGNVTIFGQSGGGAKVSTLMAMPSAKGLFHKAIVESGSLLNVSEPAQTKRLAEAVLKALGLGAGDVGKLADVPAAALVAAGEKAKASMPKPPRGSIDLGWQPVADGAAIPGQTWASGAPALSANVPMIIGSNLNELPLSLGNPGLESMGEDQAKGMSATILGGAPAGAWAVFRTADPAAKPVEVLSRIISSLFRLPAVTQAQAKARQGGAPAWLYRFDYNPKTVLDGRVRAFHCAEMAYAFDNIDRCLNSTGGTAEARELAARMSDAWIAFARTGDPNHKGLPHWPPVSTTAIPNMLFDAVCKVKDDPDGPQRAAMKA